MGFPAMKKSGRRLTPKAPSRCDNSIYAQVSSEDTQTKTWCDSKGKEMWLWGILGLIPIVLSNITAESAFATG